VKKSAVCAQCTRSTDGFVVDRVCLARNSKWPRTSLCMVRANNPFAWDTAATILSTTLTWMTGSASSVPFFRAPVSSDGFFGCKSSQLIDNCRWCISTGILSASLQSSPRAAVVLTPSARHSAHSLYVQYLHGEAIMSHRVVLWRKSTFCAQRYRQIRRSIYSQRLFHKLAKNQRVRTKIWISNCIDEGILILCIHNNFMKYLSFLL